MVDSNILRAFAAIVVAVLLSLLTGNGYAASLVSLIAIAAVLATSMRFVLLIGELNFAVAAFFGIGAYTTGMLTSVWGISFVPAMLASGLLALAISAIFGFVTLRVRGPYFLLIGFAFTEVMRIVYTRTAILGGNSGLVGIFPPEALGQHFTPFVVGLAGVLILGLALVERSHMGKIFTAIRDNENVVSSVGIPVYVMKVVCFCIASFVTGIAGSMQAFSNNVISPPDFGFLLSTFALAYLKVGGEKHPLGPLAGAVFLVLVGSWAQGFGGGEHIFYGAAIAISVLFMPDGLAGVVQTWWNRKRGPGALKPIHGKAN